MPNAKQNVGRAQLRRARENPPAAPDFRKLDNKAVLQLSRAGAKNLIEGTIQANKLKKRQTTDEVN
jgi:hypothetical protein